MMFSRMDGTCKSWCRLLRKLLAEPFALVLSSSSVHAALLGLSTACDAVGARQIGGAQVKVNRKVSCLVTGPEAKLGVVQLVAAMSVDSPFIRALRHDEEPRAFTTCVVQAAEAPTRASCQAPQTPGL